jgi:hypothetical protein
MYQERNESFVVPGYVYYEDAQVHTLSPSFCGMTPPSSVALEPRDDERGFLRLDAETRVNPATS